MRIWICTHKRDITVWIWKIDQLAFVKWVILGYLIKKYVHLFRRWQISHRVFNRLHRAVIHQMVPPCSWGRLQRLSVFILNGLPMMANFTPDWGWNHLIAKFYGDFSSVSVFGRWLNHTDSGFFYFEVDISGLQISFSESFTHLLEKYNKYDKIAI